MRPRPILVLLPLLFLFTIGCASTARTPAMPIASTTSCDGCEAPSWANCQGVAGGNPGCYCVAPPNPPTGMPPPNPPPNPTCQGGYGRWCEDGKPPVALPPVPPPTTCAQLGNTPCGLGPAAPGQLQFAVIGDWGDNCCTPSCANFVADMIKGWNERWPLDFIMTTGDNFYPDGSQAALDANIPMYDWIGPKPVAGRTPRFFPTLGNHDFYDGCCARPYLTYFSALGAYSPTGTARYYKYTLGGLIDLYSLNADQSEPDGNTVGSRQWQWLKRELAKTGGAPWRIVFFHEPPFSTHTNDDGSKNPMNWDFASMGVDLVLTGHMHAYERVVRHDLTYVTIGLSGVKGVDYITPANGCTPIEGSVYQYNGSVGALIGVVTANEMHFCLMAVDRATRDGICIDNFSFKK